MQCWPQQAPLRRGPDGGRKRNAATTSVYRPNGMRDKLGEVPALLRANWRHRLCGGERARRWRLLGVDGGAGTLSLLLLL